MISVDGLTVEFGDRALFKDISFQINEKDRIALMGKNGAGKSTLLKILAGQRKPSRGSVSAPKDTVIAYLPQHLMTEDGRTVYEEASQAFAPLFAMEKRIDDLNRQLTERTDYDSPEYYKLIEEVSALSEKYYSIDLTHFEADVEKTLLGLGFKREDLQRQTTLEEGRVVFYSRQNKQRILLKPGMQSDMEVATGKTVVSEVDPSLYSAWIEGRFVFQSLDLESILRQLQRWYDFEVFFQQQEVKNYRFRGVLSRDMDIRQALDIIEETTDLKFDIKGKTILVRK